MDYNNSSRRFRPLGSTVMALSVKYDSLPLRTDSREEWIFSSGINIYVSMRMVRVRERVGLDLILVLSTARLCSFNLSFCPWGVA